MVVDALTSAAYRNVEDQLRAQGFTNDLGQNAPICRWRCGEIRLDVMPADATPLGFTNRWYRYALESATQFDLSHQKSIRLIGAPAFIACKFDAHFDRGRHRLSESHDLEDIVTVIDARTNLIDEVIAAPATARNHIALACRRLVGDADFLDALAGFLPGDAPSQARAALIKEKMRSLSALAPVLDMRQPPHPPPAA